LLLKDVPIHEADKMDIAIGSVKLGLAALRSLDFIIDAKGGFAYLRPKETRPPPYGHNRLGAVFAPVDLQSEDLIARVVHGSPGWKAGIRNGDVLISIGELDVTKWRTDPAVLPLGRFWERAPGTKLELTLRRGKEMFKTEVVLRQILSPETGSSGNVSHE
jgi:S1-C subfamily serine protease